MEFPQTTAGITDNTMLVANQVGDVGYWTRNEWYPWYPPYVSTPIVSNINYVTEDRMTKAFKIVKKLMEKGIIKTLTIKQFIETTEEISKVL